MVDVPIEIEVLGLDVEDHGVLGSIEGERAVAFIAFRDHVVAVFGPFRVRAEDGDFRADVVAGFLAGLAEDVGGHRGGGRFPVGSGNDDAFFRVENGGEALGAAVERGLRFFGGGVGGIRRFDGGGIDDHVHLLHGGGAGRGRENQADALHPLGFRGGDLVRAADLVAHA